MKKATALVLYYTKDNKCSFRALVGALETEESLKNLKVFFLESEKELIQELDPISRNHQTTILGFSFFTAQLRETEALVKRLKEKCERRIIFLSGGSHPTGDPGAGSTSAPSRRRSGPNT